MLVLNRRPGESILIEPDIRATVLSVGEGRVWLELHDIGSVPVLRLSSTVVSDLEARLEIGPLVSVDFDGSGVHVQSAPASHAGAAIQAGLALIRRPGERVEVDDGLWIEAGILARGNPAITFGGPSVGEHFSLAVIRQAGSYVRIGVDAPNRRVYREELLETVRSMVAGGATGPPDATGAATAETVA